MRCASFFCFFRGVFDEKNEDVLPKRKDVQRRIPRIYSGLQGKEFTGRNHPPLSGMIRVIMSCNPTITEYGAWKVAGAMLTEQTTCKGVTYTFAITGDHYTMTAVTKD